MTFTPFTRVMEICLVLLVLLAITISVQVWELRRARIEAVEEITSKIEGNAAKINHMQKELDEVQEAMKGNP